MSKYLRPLLAVLLFVVVQGVTALIVSFGVKVYYMWEMARKTGESLFSTDVSLAIQPQASTGLLVSIIFISSLITLWALVKPCRYVRFPLAFDARDVHWRWVPAAILACMAGILAVNLFTERFELPDWVGGEVMGLVSTLPGVLAVGVVGPILEEAVFREALLGGMLLEKVRPWIAILISALVFGLVHGNPAQFPAAFIIGLLLGVIYYKTGNIVVPILMHMANNLICVAQAWALGDAASTFSLGEWMGGDPVALGVLGISVMACIGLLYHFVRHYPVVVTQENSDDDIKYI